MKKLYVSLFLLLGVLCFAGCLTSATAYTKRQVTPDGAVTTESKVRIVGTGDKASEVAAEGLFADGADEDLGAGVKNAKASQESTGIEGALTGMGQLMNGMANFMATAQGLKNSNAVPPVVTPAAEVCEDGDGGTPGGSLPPESVAANSAALAAMMTEARSTGKPLVVLAGNVGCSFCARLDALLDKAPQITSSTNICFYRETSPWASNQAAKWTGGGLFPVLRVTQWDSSGAVICDKKVNRPQTIADIEQAYTTCESK